MGDEIACTKCSGSVFRLHVGGVVVCESCGARIANVRVMIQLVDPDHQRTDREAVVEDGQ